MSKLENGKSPKIKFLPRIGCCRLWTCPGLSCTVWKPLFLCSALKQNRRKTEWYMYFAYMINIRHCHHTICYSSQVLNNYVSTISVFHQSTEEGMSLICPSLLAMGPWVHNVEWILCKNKNHSSGYTITTEVFTSIGFASR